MKGDSRLSAGTRKDVVFRGAGSNLHQNVSTEQTFRKPHRSSFVQRTREAAARSRLHKYGMLNKGGSEQTANRRGSSPTTISNSGVNSSVAGELNWKSKVVPSNERDVGKSSGKFQLLHHGTSTEANAGASRSYQTLSDFGIKDPRQSRQDLLSSQTKNGKPTSTARNVTKSDREYQDREKTLKNMLRPRTSQGLISRPRTSGSSRVRSGSSRVRSFNPKPFNNDTRHHKSSSRTKQGSFHFSKGSNKHSQEVTKGIHLIHSFRGTIRLIRDNSARRQNPERIVLENADLQSCPIIDNEDADIRLINYKGNKIREISNLEALTNLIFLDLYNNQISCVKNLNSLRLLRVLMLGKNRIRRIDGLSQLKKLDVLDLHSNAIEQIENINHLQYLRVLNLSGNRIQIVENLEGLTSLIELNVCRNRVDQVFGLGDLTALRRLFLSTNNIRNFHSIRCILQVPLLEELTLFKNDISTLSLYRSRVAVNCMGLKILDGSEIQPSERNIKPDLKGSNGNKPNTLPQKPTLDKHVNEKDINFSSLKAEISKVNKTTFVQSEDVTSNKGHENQQVPLKQMSQVSTNSVKNRRSQDHQQSSFRKQDPMAQRRNIISSIKKVWEKREQKHISIFKGTSQLTNHKNAMDAKEERLQNSRHQSSADSKSPDEYTKETNCFIEIKHIKSNGVESSMLDSWLFVYGEALLAEINHKKYAQVVGVHFQYALFEIILQQAASRLQQLHNLKYLCFESTALTSLQQLYALLLKLRKPDNQGNSMGSGAFGLSARLRGFTTCGNYSISKLRLYKPVLLTLFPGLLFIDGISVTQRERQAANNLLNPLVRGIMPLYEEEKSLVRISGRHRSDLNRYHKQRDDVMWMATLLDAHTPKRRQTYQFSGDLFGSNRAYGQGTHQTEDDTSEAIFSKARKKDEKHLDELVDAFVSDIVKVSSLKASAMNAIDDIWDPCIFQIVANEVAMVDCQN